MGREGVRDRWRGERKGVKERERKEVRERERERGEGGSEEWKEVRD